MKITIIGTGNIGGAIARGLAKGSVVKTSDITCTDHSQALLDRIKAYDKNFNVSTDNIASTRSADIIIIAVKPWMVETVIDDIKTVLDYDRQIIVSIAAGVTFEQMMSYLTKHSGFDQMATPTLFRVIPNTAIEVLSSMTFVSAYNASNEQSELILRIFNELGNAMLIEERLMTAGTALASSGIAFALRYIRASIEGGVELGFYPQEAQEIVVHTVKGAVDLLLANKSNPEMEIDKVTTPGGITIRGLNEMELSGFTSAVIRGLKASK
ncbi:pyrroline-5-carboxylate reductase [Parabacteroides sp. PF5-5]|uniref:pyrroline-5-carboxylate reductase n=1 Tax=unclassified Parabacteroides TaxID=2649774 RepID=UPI002473ABB7|nr:MULTISPECIES: pyrroline-5-carboxylate reductase [unclassified Parabacteroides]MDH6304257.1 pyrroline-5-carboxylate reductase [Parabacteroides sp. PH5-39]MDH6315028.1 pyrroline-5-carboxylate reductase [Parabacteroides sp. PF5-13]MDH6318688.1 pyrroline-5-carboxylate reductase [Parabacteroides sp. PH5-13]MDH6322418.1 pyrroline-5-carboxylate reductase [Parabacteroides sp. PH5-8]MDH6326447.1 pyrroline-5-carboxylate reductase [Parabacteroides sp. PH5-41]